MSFLKIPANNVVKNRRIPNAFMLFVKEQKKHLLTKCPEENKAALGAYLGRQWRSMPAEEKQVYFDKYNDLKKLEIEKSAGEKQLEGENSTRCVMKDISTDDYSKEIGMVANQGANIGIKRTDHEYFGTDRIYAAKKYKIDLTSTSNNSDLSTPFGKPKSLKNLRRSPNAFMLFAKEQRNNIDPSYRNDKKSHVSTILGNMWRDLAVSEKEKYYHEAKQLINLNRKPETPVSSKTLKRKGKIELKKAPRKDPRRSVGRPCKKRKEFLSNTTNVLRSRDDHGTGKKENELNSNKPLEKVENNGCNNSEHHMSNEFSTSSYLHQHNSVVSRFHQMTPSTELHHSKLCYCQPAPSSDYNTNDILKRYSTPDMGMSKACFGSGLFPPLFSCYPFNSSFWMYQQAMANHLFPFSSPFFSQTTCACSQPYPYANPYNNGYLSSYNSLYSGRCNGGLSYMSHSNSSATAVTATNREESVEEAKNDDHSDDGVLVVDEGVPDETQSPENGTSQHE